MENLHVPSDMMLLVLQRAVDCLPEEIKQNEALLQTYCTNLSEEFKYNFFMLWNLDDINKTAEELGVNLSEDQAADVILYIGDKVDANYGINWDSIREAILIVSSRPG